MLFSVGVGEKPRDAQLAGAIREYETRASRYWPLEIREVREEAARADNADLVREREGARLFDIVPRGAQVVACDLTGRSMSSEQFAAWLQRLQERARDVAILIAGACDLGAAWRAQSAERIALAPWTLPHELTRLVLAEQLYRAGTICRREPYHK